MDVLLSQACNGFNATDGSLSLSGGCPQIQLFIVISFFF